MNINIYNTFLIKSKLLAKNEIIYKHFLDNNYKYFQNLKDFLSYYIDNNSCNISNNNLLNNFITVLVILAGFKVIKEKVALYNSMFLIMTGFITGSFCATDAILFYVFFEAMLIPMYLIIGML